MAIHPFIPIATYAAMENIHTVALKDFTSLFVPGKRLWEPVTLRKFHGFFVERFDSGSGDFLGKFERQLEGSDDDVLLLAAELLYAQQFFTTLTGAEKKLENVSTVLSWCSQRVAIPDWAKEGVQKGIAGDQSFNQHRPHHLAWLNEFLIQWHEIPEVRRTQLLDDPWDFERYAHQVEFARGAYQPMREGWLYINFPDTFESISSRRDKRTIRDVFSDRKGLVKTQNVDRDLFDTRQLLTPEFGEGFTYYRTPLREVWRDGGEEVTESHEITSTDIEHVRQSRLRDRYADFSNDEKGSYRRIHEVLRYLGEQVIAELGGNRDYALQLTSGFHPSSGVRGGKPKDLWFGVFRKNNKEPFLGHPQLFMIVSERGLEWGFSPLTHPDDFSNQQLKSRTREIAGEVLSQLPQAGSEQAQLLGTRLKADDRWFFRRKQRLEPSRSDFGSLQEWLSFERSPEGIKNAGGGITKYASGKEIDELDLVDAVRKMASIFRPLMEGIAADAPPAIASEKDPETTKSIARSPRLAALNGLLTAFLRELQLAQKGPFQKTEALWNAMAATKARLEQFHAVSSRPDLQVNISVGQGNWATVPWIALLNTRITTTTQEGVYVVLLVSRDLKRVYLTLNQGTTNLVRTLGQREAQKQMLDIAKRTRPLVAATLTPAGFKLDNEIALGGENWLSTNYEIGTIAHIEFEVEKFPDDDRAEALLAALLAAYDIAVEAPGNEKAAPDSPGASQNITVPYNLDEALKELFLEQNELERLLAIWETKKNLVLQGAPGVGKSFLAKRLAYLLIGETDLSRVETVQFHQSYSYEDFVQGYRPDGNGGFHLSNGIFFRFCEKARLSPERKHVFIIDEINRGNLSKILGELMLLIESDKRGPEWATSLTYAKPSDPRFFVPENIFVLGLMNTADRSLSMVDYALRRRFSFVSLDPKFSSERFRSTLSERGVPENLIGLIVSRMNELNRVIGDDRINLGPGYRIGHSYFVPPKNFEYDNDWFRRVVETEIYPLLEEYWFDDPDVAATSLRKLLETIV